MNNTLVQGGGPEKGPLGENQLGTISYSPSRRSQEELVAEQPQRVLPALTQASNALQVAIGVACEEASAFEGVLRSVEETVVEGAEFQVSGEEGDRYRPLEVTGCSLMGRRSG